MIRGVVEWPQLGGCYDEGIPAQKSHHSLDLPGHWIRHSLWQRVAAPASGVHRGEAEKHS